MNGGEPLVIYWMCASLTSEVFLKQSGEGKKNQEVELITPLLYAEFRATSTTQWHEFPCENLS